MRPEKANQRMSQGGHAMKSCENTAGTVPPPSRDFETRLPICLVTGFLGSGKTTFLKQVAATHAARRLVYLVNEFSPRDIDGALVAEDHADVVTIPGGSIFCKCLVSEFIARLKELRERFDRVEGVVVEASGMADPRVFDTMLRETGLDRVYRAARVVSVVDPGSFFKLLQVLPNIRAQVEAADCVIVNKTDLFADGVVDETVAAVRKINPGADVRRGSRADVGIEIFGAGERSGESGGHYARCRDPNYRTFTVKLRRPLDVEGLRAGIAAVAEEIYRVKGYVPREAGGAFYVDYSKSGFTSRPVDTARDGHLVFITRGGLSPSARQWLEQLKSETG